MKINLDYKIDVEIREGNKQKEKLSIFYREFTQAEKKEDESVRKKFEKIFKKAKNIAKKHSSLEKKIELYHLNNDYDKALLSIDEKEELEDELESIDEELNNFAGGNQNDFAEELAKKRFDKLVSGNDKEKLIVYADGKGYVELMRSLDIAKDELEKKPSGE